MIPTNLPDLSKSPRFIEVPDKDVTPERIRAFNSVIAVKANQYQIPVADLAAVAPDASLFSEQDGFHPSDEGHSVIADIFIQLIATQIE